MRHGAAAPRPLRGGSDCRHRLATPGDQGWRCTYSRIAAFAREYRLRRLRLQYKRIVENSFFPKTVTIRYTEHRPGRGDTFWVHESIWHGLLRAWPLGARLCNIE